MPGAPHLEFEMWEMKNINGQVARSLTL